MKEEILNQENYEDILNSVPDGIMTIDKNRRIRFINESGKKILGYADEHIVGKQCEKICPINACKSDCLMERSLLTGDKISNFETEIKSIDGRFIPVSINNSLIKSNNGDVIGTIHIIRDISQIKFFTEKLEEKYSFSNLVGNNSKMKDLFDILPSISQTKTSVLIEGESGTGKELVAEAIHFNSPRKNENLIKVNCAALPEGILESELFGHVKGAFTGAISSKMGRFELADKGTIFLDEIGDMSSTLQVKLLRVLQEEEFERVGSNSKVKIDVRVISATNKDLAKLVSNGSFRNDLYFRLRVVPIYLPPLRERKDDIPLLIKHFINKLNNKMKKNINNFSSNVTEFFLNYDYPGNVRELENLLEHCFVMCNGNTIIPEHLPKNIEKINQQLISRALSKEQPLKSIEKDLIVSVLEQCKWRYQEAAKQLNISRTTLWRKIKELEINKM